MLDLRAASHNTGFLGFVLRYSLEVSPDGKRLVSVQQGVFTGIPGLDGLAAVNVIDVDATSATYLREIAYHPLPDFGQIQAVFDPKDPSGDTLLTVAADAAGDQRVQVIHLPTGATFAVSLGGGGSGVEEGGIATTSNGSFVFATTRYTDALHVLDGGFTVLGSFPLGAPGDAWFVHVEE